MDYAKASKTGGATPNGSRIGPQGVAKSIPFFTTFSKPWLSLKVPAILQIVVLNLTLDST